MGREIATHALFVEPDCAALAALARRLADGRLATPPTEVVALIDAGDGSRRLAVGATSGPIGTSGATAGAIVNAGLEAFVTALASELTDDQRVVAVSPRNSTLVCCW